MPTEDAFLKYILAEPSRREVRLIYADWLEEQGDPRAELIRLEEEMADLPVWSDRYAALKPRRNALREQIDLPWREALGYVPKHRPMFTRLPEHRIERWRLFEEFAEIWSVPLRQDDVTATQEVDAAEQRLGLRLPVAFREWYVRLDPVAAGWPQRLSRAFQSLIQIRVDQERNAVFIVDYPDEEEALEEEGELAFGFLLSDLELADPLFQVFGFRDELIAPTTVWALALLFHSAVDRGEAMLLDKERAGDMAILDIVRNRFMVCDIPIFDETEFLEGEDTLLTVARQEYGQIYVRIVARTARATANLEDDVRRRFVKRVGERSAPGKALNGGCRMVDDSP
jgi:uncharacterized protein (TIGR02996 family)